MLVAAALLTGCAVKDGRCYPIVGFGWTIVDTNATTIVKSTAMGLNTGAGQSSIGFSSFTIISVPTNSNVIIDLKQ